MLEKGLPVPPKNRLSLTRPGRIVTPTVLQMEMVECGAAVLGIILAYYGRYVPLEELRIACGVSRDGSKASNILKAARQYGLEAQAYRKEPHTLTQLHLPLIIHWKFSHFVVLEGFGKNKVYVNDPSSGPTTVSYEEFNQSFTGVTLELKPGPNFVRAGRPFSSWRTLRQRLQGSETALLYLVLAELSLVVPGLVVPGFSRVFVDYYLQGGSENWLGPLLLGVALTALISGLLLALRNHYLLKLETHLAVTTSRRFFWHVLRLPLEYYFQRYSGDLAGRVALNDQVAGLLAGRVATTILDLLTLVFYASLMFLYDPLLALIGIGFTLLNLLALRFISVKRVDLNQQVLQESGRLAGISQSGLNMIETIKATGREADFFGRWAGNQARISRLKQKLALYSQLLSALPPLLTALSMALIVVVGAGKVMTGQFTPGALVAFQALLLSFAVPVNRLVELGSTLQEVEGQLKRLDDVLNSPALEPSQVEEIEPKLKGALEIRNLSFGYNRLEPALIKNFNLTLKPGQRVALVGGSGSGKSTIARLVSGLFEPWEGEILFDGKSWQRISRSTLARSLAVVDQDIFLFEGSIRDNLSLWNTTITDEALVRAAKDACIYNDIIARPGGYDSEVEEAGRNFSGGQAQRLEIARALALDPTLLVLDEATSALDPLTEKLLNERLRQRGCTCLIIAHRLSTIRNCDEIIVMEGGEIVERGTHDQLKNNNGPYSRLIKNQ
jgi:NHLM bacteriocin system ABC transporter peptidase/ATP-binding protein